MFDWFRRWVISVLQGTELHAANFVADGPVPQGSSNVGFLAGGGYGPGSFLVGVQGTATAERNAEQGVGVQGITRYLEEQTTLGSGVGVEGLSAGGTGVRGRDDGNGTGVEGHSRSGTGVHGISDSSVGVQGEGVSIGVLGGGNPGLPGLVPNH